MASIDFPNNPEIGELFTVGDRTWRWTGVVWETITTATAVGPQGPPGGFDTLQVIQNLASNYSLEPEDAGKLFTNSFAVAVTVQGIEVGKRAEFLQTASGKISFAAGLGDTVSSLDNNFVTAGPGAHVTVYCIAPNNYWLVGDLASE